MNRLGLVTFDITETLLLFRVPPALKYAEVGASFGISADPEKLKPSFKRQWQHMTISHPNFGLKTGLGWERWWKEIVKNSFQESVECEIDAATLESVGNHLIELYKTPACWKVADGAHDLLLYLKNCKLPLGVISNFDERLETILQVMGLRMYFDFVLTSYTSGYEKPDGRIFELALTELKNLQLNSSDALHVGNMPETDYFGARKAGWNAILIHENPKKVLEQYKDIRSDHVFQTLKQLLVHLAR